MKSAAAIPCTGGQSWWASFQGHLVINPHSIRAFRSFHSGQWAAWQETLTSRSRGLITPFGTLKAGSYWLRQGWWNEVAAAFIFHIRSMETTPSSMQSSLLIQVAWQLKSPVSILSVMVPSPDEAQWAQSALTAAQTELDALSCNTTWMLSTTSFHTKCPENHPVYGTDGAVFPCLFLQAQIEPKTQCTVWLWRKTSLWGEPREEAHKQDGVINLFSVPILLHLAIETWEVITCTLVIWTPWIPSHDLLCLGVPPWGNAIHWSLREPQTAFVQHLALCSPGQQEGSVLLWGTMAKVQPQPTASSGA